MRESFAANMRFIILIGFLELVLLAMLPFVLMLDEHSDRQRPMYRDVNDMAALQYEQARQAGKALPMTLGAGESATIAGVDYAPSPGITLTVELTEAGFCVRARNTYGDETDWQCWADGKDPSLSDGVPR